MLFVCVLLGFALSSPALDSGLLADDVGHRTFILAQLAGEADQPWWDMFVLVGATPDELERLRYLGHVPWWTNPEVHVAFWRPLTAATHYLDYSLWPDSPWAMHLHQLLWHALACGLGWALFRRLCSSPSAAGAAALGLSLTHLHVSAAAWLAHRNAVLVLVFTLSSLLAHDRWRRDGWRPGAALGPLGLGAALLSGEMGLAALGFLLAYAATIDEASWGRRALSVLPYLLVVLVWRGIYDSLGYGAVGSGAYVDPLTEPLTWVSAAPIKLVKLVIYLFSPPGTLVSSPLAVLVCSGLVMVALFAVLARRPAPVRRVALFASLGILLSLIPMTTTIAGSRLLVVATVGSALLFGELIDAALDPGRPGAKLGALLVLIIHYLVAPVENLRFAFAADRLSVAVGDYATASGLEDERLRHQSVVILHSPDLLTAKVLPAVRQARGLNRPNFFWVLHAEPSEPRVEVIDPRTIQLHDPEGWLRGVDTGLMRGPSAPFAVDDEVRTLDYLLTVREVDDGRPTTIEVRFRAPFESETFAFLTWAGDDFAVVTPGS